MCFAALSAAELASAQVKKESTKDVQPQALREFRGVWVATVANIDWPSKQGLSTEEQKRELIEILDKTRELNMNAVVLQVRPACDAIYESKLEPWSYVLTGEMGKAPEPYYDPLQFAVEECHKRGLEIHCWFNPYRALHPSYKGELPENHISKLNPKIVRKYGDHLWMDPVAKETQDHSINVIMDVVKRYDIDGVHMDDYFYPYKSYDNGADFPDDDLWEAYKKEGGKLDRADWRRDAVNKFVERLYKEIKAEKKHVKFGLSPFGIARPGSPPEVTAGFSQYDELYADAQLWLNKGWVDYYTPQLYWRIASPQNYLYLLKYWMEENTHNRHMWPGLYTSKYVGDPATVEEIATQIAATYFLGATGNVHFSMKPFLTNVNKVNDSLTRKGGVYEKQALIPASPWLDDEAPAKPSIKLTDENETTKTLAITPASGKEDDVRVYSVYTKKGAAWTLNVHSATETTVEVAADDKGVFPSHISVATVDRNGNESERVTLQLGEEKAVQETTKKVDQVQ